MELAGFSALAKKVNGSLHFVDGKVEGRDFWILAKGKEIMRRQRSDGRRPSKLDQLLRIERKGRKTKVSALLQNMDAWKRRIEALPKDEFEVNTRTTPRHIERTTFTGVHAAFDHHRPFLVRLIRACTHYDKPR